MQFIICPFSFSTRSIFSQFDRKYDWMHFLCLFRWAWQHAEGPYKIRNSKVICCTSESLTLIYESGITSNTVSIVARHGCLLCCLLMYLYCAFQEQHCFILIYVHWKLFGILAKSHEILKLQESHYSKRETFPFLVFHFAVAFSLGHPEK